DMVALKRAIKVSSISGLAITKLDVLDGLDPVRICVGYQLDDQELSTPPLDTDTLARCQPKYLDLPGWQQSTAGIRDFDALPDNTKKYLRTVAELAGCPIDIISTGPERDDTMVLRHPFSS
ncbi:adenylosuccinate synthetase, partial [Achromatium sp. WMS2]